MATWYESNFHPCHLYGIDDMFTNGLYDLSVNCLDLLSINVFPLGVGGLHEFSITGLKKLSINIIPRDVRESVDVTSESGLPGLNVLRPESAQEQ